MSRLLQSSGHAVAIAGSVADAMQWANGKRLDLLICDLGLPDGSGLDLVKQLRKTSQFAGVCLTGKNGQDQIDDIRSAGFDAHLTKPVDFTKLESLIGDLTSRPGGLPTV